MTLTEAIAHRDAWLAADLAVAQNQSYTIEGRTLSRADASEIGRRLTYWENMVRKLTAVQNNESSFGYVDFS